jgi:hypothetical protein
MAATTIQFLDDFLVTVNQVQINPTENLMPREKIDDLQYMYKVPK